MKGIVLFVIVLFILLLAIVVGARNSSLITVELLVIQTEMRLSTFMIFSLFAGFFVGISTILTKYLVLRLRFANMKKRLDKLSLEKSK
ncbi:lipopolysaccharide assembly protein LapA domain-containing protein [Glaciecola petra]|uniref:Lipopolysaccharide assembly protein LapA domain-containing protein n=1 Tax=Glaciecola petra TaxID=3075602 RepID=A0ABU2ZPT6_9ALTE|nr:lipopolysaccharide assembly protein LapA domain-containing protein [Aestuariibacter sp. P117]MDT0594281.1 lipopolysaccharide assembly protein LapA domain-containing protein [Aestuariibacter sp. P117]